ncbi:MAG TPA: hypothetical protein VE154_01945, partial [Chthoniobacterales bacterium]|nr:hypothetical protein [Chthoniobacterales bacterium]
MKIQRDKENARLQDELVSCPRNNMNFAGSQLAVFQGANENPYLDDTGRESNAEQGQCLAMGMSFS